jgi:cytochrome c oxidase assembly factor CtaG
VVNALASLVLAVVLVAYLRGWRYLSVTGHRPPRWRLAAYGLGLATAAVALLSLDELADASFSMHMIQHLLLVMVAAPLVTLGNPLPCILWGLPRGARAALASTLKPRAMLRRALSVLTFMPVAGLLYVVTVWVWHVPFLYDAAVEHEGLHAFEHVTFFVVAMLFWWPIVQPAPRLHARLHTGFQILYLVVATALNTALGMILSIPERALYPHYARLAPAVGLSAVDDQALGGGLMWMMGHMYLLPILLILYEIARDSEREPDDAPGA